MAISIVRPDGKVYTTFHDGRILEAAPNYDAESINRARELGYSGDVLAMTRDHDPLHTRLCTCLIGQESPALLGALDGVEPGELEHAEEAMVLAAQKFLQLWRKVKPAKDMRAYSDRLADSKKMCAK
jgi:hypothetical protein